MNYYENVTQQFILTSNIEGNANATKYNGTFNSDVEFRHNFLPNLGNGIYSTMRVLHAQFPNSWNTINENNNTLKFNGITLTIAEGNYNASTFMTALREEISNIDPQVFITLNQSTGKFAMTSINPFSINASTDSLLYKVLGLDTGTYNGVFDFAAETYSVAFPFPCNFAGTRCLYVRTNDLNLGGKHFNVTNDSGTLCVVPVTVASFGMLNYQGDASEIQITNALLDKLRVQIVDDDGRAIDFNNLNWTLTIEIKTVLLKYRPPTQPTFADFLAKEVAAADPEDV